MKKHFIQLVDELRDHPNINIAQAQINEPVTQAAIAEIESCLQTKLPDEITSFYRQMNGARILWTLNDDFCDEYGIQTSNGGSIQLLPIEKVFGNWKDVIWFTEDDHVLRHIKPFDFFVPEACAVFYSIPEQFQVYYHYCGEELHPTGYSFNEYLERLLQARGYVYWMQTLHVAGMETISSEDFFADMPKIFDDFNSSLFVPNTTGTEIPLFR